jgi:tetratricopeptide (TPR) repeat protein
MICRRHLRLLAATTVAAAGIGLLADAALAHPLLDDRIAAINTSLADTPNDPTLYRLRGDHYRVEGQLLLALADYTRAARLAPQSSDLQFSLGELYLAVGRPALALRYFEGLLELQPQHHGALLGRARALSSALRIDEAHAAFELVVRSSPLPHPDIYLEWAGLLGDSARPDEAVAILDRGIRELGPVTAFDARAVDLLVASGRYNDALERLRGLAERSPRSAEWLTRRAVLLESLGRFEEARAGYLEARTSLASLSPSARSRRSSQNLAERISLGLARLDSSASLGG